MSVFRGNIFTQQTIVLDGNEFHDCTFHECDLIYRGGSLEFKSKAVRCNWVFEGAAQRTITLLRYLGYLPPTGVLRDWPTDA